MGMDDREGLLAMEGLVLWLFAGFGVLQGAGTGR